MGKNTLVIPMKTSAWVVNSAVVNPDPTHPEYTIRRAEMDYSLLTNFDSPVPDPFGTDPFIGDNSKKGIYLHWILSSGFRHGQQTDAKNNPQGPIDFPYVPNRWLVVRYSGPLEKRLASAWMIESDYLDHQQGTVPFPDPNDVGQTQIGRSILLASWQETGSGKPLFLKATSSGDIHFSFFQAYNQNVFSYHDSLLDLPDGESDLQQTLSYCITGWYSNPSFDPLANCKTADDFFAQLKRYQWQVENPTGQNPEIANQIICQGMVTGVQWDDTPGAKAPPSPQNNFNLTDIKVAIGSNAAEAISALVAANNSHWVPQELLDAFTHGLLDKLDAPPDGDETVAQYLQQEEFGSQSGGLLWTIASQTAQDSDLAASALTLTPAQAKNLDNLNSQQIALEIQQQILKKLQWDLYALWWKYGSAQSYPKLPISPDKLAEIKQQLDLSINGSLAQQVQLEQAAVNTLQTALIATQQALIAELAKEAPDKLLKKINRSAFFSPQDPVLLVSGIQDLSVNRELASLPCRYLDDCIAGLYTKPDKSQIITSQDIIPLLPTLDVSQLPVPLQNLLAEFFLLDASNATSLKKFADEAGITVAALQQIMSAHLPANYAGALPLYGLDAWSQPWQPFFSEWEVEWSPISFDHWEFNGDRYVLKSIPTQPISPQTIHNRNLITSHATFALKGQLKRLIDQDPSFKQSLSKWGLDPDELLKCIDGWPVLALTLSGLHNQLVQRDMRVNRTPLAQAEPAISNLIGDQAHNTPNPGAAPVPFQPPSSTFQSVRDGQFFINRLSVIDRFGQVVNAIQSNTSKAYEPLISNQLTPDISLEPQLHCYIQLTPRIIQPMRLDVDWLLGNDDSNTQRLMTSCQANPIAGWVLPNYLDQGLQFYDAQGNSLGELRLSEDDNGQQICSWEKSFYSPYATPEDMSQKLPWLCYMLEAFVAKDPTKRVADPVEAYNGLREVIDQALITKANPDIQYSQYISAFIGRPLALARVRWQLNLLQPAYVDQSWAQTLPSVPPVPFAGYSFPIQVGNTNINQDGVIGYYLANNFNQFYSLYNAKTVNGYILSTISNRFTLTPTNPDQDTIIFTTVLMDPFAKVHGYSDILPVQSLNLPAPFIKSAITQMEVTFNQGPLLTLRNSAADSSAGSATLRLSMPSVKGDWSWLEPQADGSWQELGIQNANPQAQFEPQPNEIVEGSLLFKNGLNDEKRLSKRSPSLEKHGLFSQNTIPKKEVPPTIETNSLQVLKY